MKWKGLEETGIREQGNALWDVVEDMMHLDIIWMRASNPSNKQEMDQHKYAYQRIDDDHWKY